jgi:hypothetical protein
MPAKFPADLILLDLITKITFCEGHKLQMIHLAVTTYRLNDGLRGSSHIAYQEQTLLTYVIPANGRLKFSHFFS